MHALLFTLISVICPLLNVLMQWLRYVNTLSCYALPSSLPGSLGKTLLQLKTPVGLNSSGVGVSRELQDTRVTNDINQNYLKCLTSSLEEQYNWKQLFMSVSGLKPLVLAAESCRRCSQRRCAHWRVLERRFILFLRPIYATALPVLLFPIRRHASLHLRGWRKARAGHHPAWNPEAWRFLTPRAAEPAVSWLLRHL